MSNKIFISGGIRENRKLAIYLCILVILCFAAYFNTFDAAFHLDDKYHIGQNNSIEKLEQFKSISTWKNVNQRPFAMFTFAINYSLHEREAFGYHLTNLIIHLLSSLLVFLFVREILTSRSIRFTENRSRVNEFAFFVALLFSLHPLQTQSVTYIIQRMTALAGFFYILSAWMYLKSRVSFSNQKSRLSLVYFVIAAVSALAAILSKQNAITVPVIWFIIEWLLVRDKNGKSYKKLQIAYLITFGVAFLIIILAGFIPSETDTISRYQYFLTQLRMLPKYIFMSLVPIDQNIDHDVYVSVSLWNWKEIAGMAFLLILIFIGFWQAHKNKIISFGIFWFLISISVESSIIPIRDVFFEHRMYVPILGIMLIFIFLIYKLFYKSKLFYSRILLISIALAFGLLTYNRNKVWKTPFSLWSDAAAKSPDKARPNMNLGIAYLEKQDHQNALKYFNKAIKNDPGYYEAYFNRGNVYIYQGKYKQAIDDLSTFVEAYPNLADPRNQLGKAKLLMNDLGGAIMAFNEAIAIDPSHADSYFNRGNARFFVKDYNGAITDLEKALELGKKDEALFNNLGQAYVYIDSTEIAKKFFDKAISSNPNYTRAIINKAQLAVQEKDFNLALELFDTATDLEPQNASVYYGKGLVLYQIKNYKEALQNFEIAEKLGHKIDNRLMQDLVNKLNN